MKTIKNLSLIGVITFIFFSFTHNVDQDGWIVPDEYKTMSNPTDGADKENMAIGKSLYNKHCKSCHGKEGFGDGPKLMSKEVI